ncbi:MAG: tetratricopeptide repeat protein [Nannocystaceae bacterium]|nr:tetratricopeptide repeat protein [Nannocystaceae bacterium]
MRNRSLIIVALALAVACDSDADTPATTPVAEKAPDRSTDPVLVKKPADKPSPSDKPAPSAKPTQEWLIWYAQGDGWVTRWIADVDGSTKTLAQRQALVHTNGTDLFQIVRRDAAAPLETCACMEPEFSEPGECQKTGSVQQPGLVAINVGTGKERDLVKPDGELIFGEIYGISLEVVGGVDGGLIVRRTDAGYYCGAHQSIDGGDTYFELGTSDDPKWPTLKFPRAMKEEAARWFPSKGVSSMLKLVQDCEGAVSLDEFVTGQSMDWYALDIGLEAGKPKLTWGFAASVYYVCSPDYISHGQAMTGLIPEASAVGLAGPLPAGLVRGMADLGSKRVVGWGELKLSSSGRDALLHKFSETAETKWPAPEAVLTAAQEKPSSSGDAKVKLAEGRTKSRAKDYTGAIVALDAAIAAEPKLARAWAARGYAKLLDGQFDAAQTDCERALELGEQPRFKASVHYNLGLIAQKRGDKAAAKKAFAASLALRPNKEVRKALDSL